MVSKFLTVPNEQGFHMRAAAVFVKEMSKYPCTVTIKFNDTVCNGKSTISLMIAGIRCGSEIELVCDGERENEALAEGAEIIQNRFGE